MNYRVMPIEERHIGSYHAAVGSVARERAYLVFLEAPPLESTIDLVRKISAKAIRSTSRWWRIASSAGAM